MACCPETFLYRSQTDIDCFEKLYSDKENINLLTALLLADGWGHIVACPGSRNAAVVHNLLEAGLTLHPVTDERSAAFVALGIIEATGRPAAVCVTSGSALLGTLPAVAEAYYRSLPLLVISADRPCDRIGQLEGQTIPQTGALAPYAETFTANEVVDVSTRRYAQRSLREALLNLHAGRPVHINLPINEPLFHFTIAELPKLLPLHEWQAAGTRYLPDAIVGCIVGARFPVLVIGQMERGMEDLSSVLCGIDAQGSLLVMPDVLSGCGKLAWRTAVAEHAEDLPQMCPDLILHIGAGTVHKRWRMRLQATNAPTIRIADTPVDALSDTYDGLTDVVRMSPVAALHDMMKRLPPKESIQQWKDLLCTYRNRLDNFEIEGFTAEYVTGRFVRSVADVVAGAGYSGPLTIHAANSMAVRNVACCLRDDSLRIVANRGVNGIEGSLSTAVGFSLVSEQIAPIVIGDLSFFYDQNALWNKTLDGRLRILLLNNGGGEIFEHLPGLSHSPAYGEYVSASHHTEAASIAEAYNIEYIRVERLEQLDSSLALLLRRDAERPVMVEVLLTHG